MSTWRLHIDLHRKRYGYCPEHFERKHKKEAREVHKRPATAQKALGIKGKMFAKKRYAEKMMISFLCVNKLAMHEESSTKCKVDDDVHDEAVLAYLLDRDNTTRAKVLSNTIKQKRKEKAGKWEVPLPKVRPVAEDEMFKVLRTGKRKTLSLHLVIRFLPSAILHPCLLRVKVVLFLKLCWKNPHSVKTLNAPTLINMN
ncbi:hypothetical protein UlMin_013997 [Ulmus minor]